VLPCLIFEDEHLLVVNKPAGLNTHAPSPYAGEGLYDWLRHREPRWAALAIIHRLDKETSGVMVFAKTPQANRSLTAQFTARAVRKKYLLLTDRPARQKEFVVKSTLVRRGDRYQSQSLAHGGGIAETRFRPGRMPHVPGKTAVHWHWLEAELLTGRTHQIRVHAAASGIPILGDTLYGGTPAPRVCLQAVELQLKHPASGEVMQFSAPIDLPPAGIQSYAAAQTKGGLLWTTASWPSLALRQATIEGEETQAYRLVHGASDGCPGWYLDRVGDFLLSQSESPLTAAQQNELEHFAATLARQGAYHKLLARQPGQVQRLAASPRLVFGKPAPERFAVRENGVAYELSFSEGYSMGLFLDQRDNRRRLLSRHVAAGFPLCLPPPASRQWEALNTFAYTCGFSVCAARAGARVTSIDLSKRYLEWGRRNFRLNQLDPEQHNFIHGDTLDWLRRLEKKKRLFDVILLDPPTFSQSKTSGIFRAEKDYEKLITAALPLLPAGGVLFASTNAAAWPPEEFIAVIERAIRRARRKIIQRHYVPQPLDFPVSRAEPAYLKTVWLRVE